MAHFYRIIHRVGYSTIFAGNLPAFAHEVLFTRGKQCDRHKGQHCFFHVYHLTHFTGSLVGKRNVFINGLGSNRVESYQLIGKKFNGFTRVTSHFFSYEHFRNILKIGGPCLDSQRIKRRRLNPLGFCALACSVFATGKKHNTQKTTQKNSYEHDSKVEEKSLKSKIVLH